VREERAREGRARDRSRANAFLPRFPRSSACHSTPKGEDEVGSRST
jgi:hypothetical protein